VAVAPKVVPVKVVMLAEVTVAVVICALAPRSWVVAVVPKVVPVRVVMFAEVLERLSIVALVDLSVVIVADVKVAFVRDKLETVRLVTPRLVTVALVALSVVIVAVVAVKILTDAAPATERLLGFVPTSIIALALFIENKRLSAVLTANSAPPAKLVRLAVPGIEPGVSLFFVRITGISRCLRLWFQWH
jgi:hypothetical protein